MEYPERSFIAGRREKLLWETVSFLKKNKLYMHMYIHTHTRTHTMDPATSLQGIYLREMKTSIYKNPCIQLFTTALFTKANTFL